MSVDKAFREMIRQEIESQLRPLQNAVSRLQDDAFELGSLRVLAERLAPLGTLLGGAPVRRRGRPPGRVVKNGVRRRGPRGSNERPCALVGCKNQARSKGYCAAHYQKFRNLSLTRRLPSDWKEHAPPNSVTDVVLPRGRAAAKLLAGRK
ncbi:MAG: cell wall protein [Myxococcota bacterium]